MDLCVKSEVSITNISGIIGINVAKREQILLPTNKPLRCCPNYLCAYAQMAILTKFDYVTLKGIMLH